MNKRATYVPSGRTELRDLWPHLLMLTAVAGLTAVVYAVLVERNAYAVGYVWLLPLGFKAWLIRTAIRDSHCRNPLLAALLFAFIGFLLFAATYHIDQCRRWGVAWHRLDRLPGYMTFRMETDGWWGHDARMPLVRPLPAPDNPRVTPHCTPRIIPNTHGFVLLAEFVVEVLVPGFIAWRYARRPYSERLKAWFRDETTALTTASALVLEQALRNGTLERWTEVGVEKTDPKEDHVRLNVWFCARTDAGNDVEPEIYLTLGDGEPQLLTIDEIAAMTGVFPDLKDWADVPVELRLAPADPDSTAAQLDEPSGDVGVHQTVAAEHAGRCKNPTVKYRGRVLAYLVMAMPLPVIALFMILVVPVHDFLVRIHLEWCTPLYVIGVVLPLYFAVRWFYDPREDMTYRFLVAYYESIMRSQALRRRDALFDVNGDDVFYVEIVPRRAWTNLNEESDRCEAGFARFDALGGAFLFEGDRYRWSIPFSAVRGVDCEVAILQPEFHVAVLKFDTADGLKELPLLAGSGLPGTNRFERTAALHDLLHDHWNPPTVPLMLTPA